MLTWNISQDKTSLIHLTSVNEIDDEKLCQTVEACAEKAVSLLKNNIQDDSLYLLFEWDVYHATLSICVTDANKTQDSPQIVRCVFSNLTAKTITEDQRLNYVGSIKFWLHDYLACCSAFSNYSLVTIFHSSTRDKTELL